MSRPGLTSKYQRVYKTNKIKQDFWFSPNIVKHYLLLLAFEQTNFYETKNFIFMFDLK